MLLHFNKAKSIILQDLATPLALPLPMKPDIRVVVQLALDAAVHFEMMVLSATVRKVDILACLGPV